MKLKWKFENGCIRSTSHKPSSRGYVPIRLNGKRIDSIPREIIRRRHGNIDGLVSRHTCDNKWCINPSHLLIGTPADNTHDRDIRGRNNSCKGTQHGMCKLTEDEIREIRSSSEVQWKVGKRFGISQPNVSMIKTGRNWKHL